MIIHNIEQGSAEWFAVRKLKLTASKADAIATAGKGLETLCLELVAEAYSKAEPERYTNEAMERGNQLEAEARGMYEALNDFLQVQEVGFVEYSKFVGCSPDGLVGDDGLVEIKCPQDKTYANYLIIGDIDSKYAWQMQMQMLITGRKWCDYVVYNPNFKRSCIIVRVEADKEKQEKLLAGFKKGEEILKQMIEKMEKANVN
jgi:putative phage-type endonuclease